jgi:hypothetical protein
VRRSIVRRAWWGLLVLIHAAPLLSATQSLVTASNIRGAVINCAVLWLACAFFVLKFLDVAFLRWRMRRSNWLTLALACALVHHDVVATAADRTIAQVPAAVAVSALVEGWTSRARLIPEALRFLARLLRTNISLKHQISGLAWSCAVASVVRFQALQPSSPRAPPV